jgi:hypothetical protein
MSVKVFLKNGLSYHSDFCYFSFRGFDLEKYIDAFFSEKYLEIRSKDSGDSTFVPIDQIESIWTDNREVKE